MSQKLPVNNFEWIEDNFQFNGNFIKNYNYIFLKLIYMIKLNALYTQEI